MDTERQIVRLEARQYGLITTSQLTGLGITRRQLCRRVQHGRLRVVRRFVYSNPVVPPSWEQSVLAAVLSAGPDALASHATAGALWQLKHCEPGAGIHLTSVRQLRMHGVLGHIRLLRPNQRCTYRAIPVTTPEQTIVDLAGTLTPTELGECIDDGLRRRLVSLARLRRLVEAAGTLVGRHLRPLRRALADRIPGYDPGANDWEQEMDRRWDRLGLPPARRQYSVVANGHNYRLDRAIPDLKIGVEWNGFESHGTRAGFDRDSDRRADLTAAGWHMLDFTSRSSPDRICRAVLAAVNQRRPAGPGATAGRPP